MLQAGLPTAVILGVSTSRPRSLDFVWLAIDGGVVRPHATGSLVG